VAEGDGARLFPCGDAAALTIALARALDDAEWAVAARARNRRVVEERADRELNLGRIETLFAELASARRGGRR
jgi:glycosyltransferase involved in cell wall biosynthesis